MDKIYIRDLTLRCVIGAFPDERRDKQDVVLNIVLSCDCAPAAATDRLEDAVDYKTIKKRVIRLVEQSQFQLIETLAEQVAAECLNAAGVSEVSVTADKPGALRFARSVAVEITRRKTP